MAQHTPRKSLRRVQLALSLAKSETAIQNTLFCCFATTEVFS
jgi:hypothetical protein